MLQKEFMNLKKKNSMHFEENLLFSGVVIHERIKPFKHSFKYNLTYFWFDINLLDNYKLLKKNKFSLFSFFDRDHPEWDHRFHDVKQRGRDFDGPSKSSP